MAQVAAQTESRNVDRFLAHTRDHIVDRVRDQSFNHSPAAAIFFGQMLGDFGGTRMTGEGKSMQTGGESIVVRMNLGKGNAKRMAGAWDTHGTAPSDTVRYSRANWMHYSSNLTVSDSDLLINVGEEALGSMLEHETELAMYTLADLVADDIYNNNGVGTAVTDLNSIISANDSVQGISGATYTDFNSRGVSARGTTPSSISFAGGSFAAQGISDMRIAYNNASEGSKRPNCVLSSYAEYEFYEGSLTPEQRFTTRNVGDGSFDNLAFKSVPYLPDDKAPVGTQWFLRVGDELKIVCLTGADFTPQPFKRAEQQEARVSEFQLKANLCVGTRKFQNKITTITA
jgi:hypothetical protein